MASRLQDVLLRGVAASRPAATAVANGTLYFATDTSVTTQSDGATWNTYSAGAGGGGVVVQVVHTQTGAVATGTTLIPLDDTIPQNTEGVEYMSLAITPTDATHRLKIDVTVLGGVSIAAWQLVALFQDSTANALAATGTFVTTATAGGAVSLTHVMTAGTTSATTFKVRIGMQTAGTYTFNGQVAARRLGGVAASTITITELTP